MSSATITDQMRYQPVANYGRSNMAIVESILSIPERSQWLLIKQQEATKSYIVSDLWNTRIATNLEFINSFRESEQIEIIKNAQYIIRHETKSLDPEIRELVNKNFEELLWK